MRNWAKYLGIPFSSGGRDWDGCDCWGLVRLVLREEFGRCLPAFSGTYTHALDHASTARAISAHTAAVRAHPVAHPEPGDVALLRYGGFPCHIGVVIATGRIMHTDRGVGVSVSPDDGPHLRGRVEGYYRVD